MTDIENPDAGQGTVVLDIGGDIGALVIRTPPEMVDLELEICPSGRRADPPHHAGPHGHDHEHRWPHVAVLRRRTPLGTAHAAVFPSLRAGSYDVWVKPDGPVLLTAEVHGGQVTELACDPVRGGAR